MLKVKHIGRRVLQTCQLAVIDGTSNDYRHGQKVTIVRMVETGKPYKM